MVIGDTTLSVYLTLKHKDRSDWNTGDFKNRDVKFLLLSPIFFSKFVMNTRAWLRQAMRLNIEYVFATTVCCVPKEFLYSLASSTELSVKL